MNSNSINFVPSSLVQDLPEAVMSRYLDKIAVVDYLDPYTIKTNSAEIPVNVSIGMVVHYLLSYQSPFSEHVGINDKSMEAYKKFESGFVSSVTGCLLNDVHVVQGKVQRSMRLSEPPHRLWIIINREGFIQSAHCICPVGITESCSHVAAVLYALANLYSITTHQKLTVTDVPAYWLRPNSGIKENLFSRVADVDYGRRTVRFEDVTFKRSSKEDFCELLSKLKSDGSNAAVLKKFCGSYEHQCMSCEDLFVPDHVLTNTNILIQGLFKIENEEKSLEELREMAKLVRIEVNPEEIELVERLTKHQASNPFWRYIRIGRITASILKDVAAASVDFPPPKLCLLRQICHPSPRVLDTPALAYGRAHESRGKEYVKSICANHLNAVVRECGIFIWAERPYIAASPDLILDCSCCGRVAIEIKCPYRLKKKTNLTQQLTLMDLVNTRDSFVEMDGENFILKKSHKYYYQVQAQIFVTNAAYGLFVIWSKEEQLSIVVQKDLALWLRSVLKCEKYFYQIVLPEILANYFTNNLK